MIRILSFVALTLAALGLATAEAQPSPPPAGAPSVTPPGRTHEGLYLRAHLGPTYVASGASDDVTDVTISGSGSAFELAVGESVRPNLIVFGELFYDLAFAPSFESGGVSTTPPDTSAGTVGVGLGVARYFMPANVHVSATLGVHKRVTVEQDGREIGASDVGPGVSLMGGKEWDVGRHVGLGAAARLFVGAAQDQDAEMRWVTVAAALVMTATYN